MDKSKLNDCKQKEHILQSMDFDEPTSQSHEELDASKSYEDSNDPIGYEENHYHQEPFR